MEKNYPKAHANLQEFTVTYGGEFTDVDFKKRWGGRYVGEICRNFLTLEMFQRLEDEVRATLLQNGFQEGDFGPLRVSSGEVYDRTYDRTYAKLEVSVSIKEQQ